MKSVGIATTDAQVHLLKNLIIEGDLWATYTTLQSTR